MATISSELLEEERRIFGAQFASPACEEALANTEVVKRHSHCNVCVCNQTTPNQNTNTKYSHVHTLKITVPTTLG